MPSDEVASNELPGDDLVLTDEAELNELLAELEEVNSYVESLYIPHAKQKLFHCAQNKVRAVFGGNRSGKTEMGVNELRFHATGEYPEWYPDNKRIATPTRGRVVVTDYRVAAKEVLEPKLQKWLGDRILKIERVMGNISKVHVQHITGGISTFDVLTHEQDTKQFEGWSGHYVWFDEPPPRDKYVACLRGTVDYGGRIWITATPLDEPWLYDEIFLNKARDAWHITVSIWDNPHIGKTEIEAFLISLTPEEREARESGKFLHLTGRIYSEFDYDIHIIDNLPKGHELWPVWFVLDPADRRPHHGIWAKVDPFNNIYVFDEFVYKGTIKDTSKQILMREISNRIDPLLVIRILDPNKGQSPSPTTGLKLIQEFASHAVYFQTALVNDDLALGHLAVKEKLSWDKRYPISTTNHPKLYFLRNTTRECVRQLLAYVWDDWRGKNAASRSEKEKPKDINKDMPDCVRYLCMSNPLWYYPYADEEPVQNFYGTSFIGSANE